MSIKWWFFISIEINLRNFFYILHYFLPPNDLNFSNNTEYINLWSSYPSTEGNVVIPYVSNDYVVIDYLSWLEDKMFSIWSNNIKLYSLIKIHTFMHFLCFQHMLFLYCQINIIKSNTQQFMCCIYFISINSKIV